jgi:hypothetical protein
MPAGAWGNLQHFKTFSQWLVGGCNQWINGQVSCKYLTVSTVKNRKAPFIDQAQQLWVSSILPTNETQPKPFEPRHHMTLGVQSQTGRWTNIFCLFCLICCSDESRRTWHTQAENLITFNSSSMQNHFGKRNIKICKALHLFCHW